jgi:hypothetical protein
MQHVRGELRTEVVDLTRMPLTELPCSEDPMLIRSVMWITSRAECNRTGVLQNQAPDEA